MSMTQPRHQQHQQHITHHHHHMSSWLINYAKKCHRMELLPLLQQSPNYFFIRNNNYNNHAETKASTTTSNGSTTSNPIDTDITMAPAPPQPTTSPPSVLLGGITFRKKDRHGRTATQRADSKNSSGAQNMRSATTTLTPAATTTTGSFHTNHHHRAHPQNDSVDVKFGSRANKMQRCAMTNPPHLISSSTTPSHRSYHYQAPRSALSSSSHDAAFFAHLLPASTQTALGDVYSSSPSLSNRQQPLATASAKGHISDASTAAIATITTTTTANTTNNNDNNSPPIPDTKKVTSQTQIENIRSIISKEELDNVKLLCLAALKGQKRLSQEWMAKMSIINQNKQHSQQLSLSSPSPEEDTASANETSSPPPFSWANKMQELQDRQFKTQLMALDMKEKAMRAQVHQMELAVLDELSRARAEYQEILLQHQQQQEQQDICGQLGGAFGVADTPVR